MTTDFHVDNLIANEINGQPASAVVLNPMTMKGDIIIGGASGVPARFPVGADGQVPEADSTQALGWKWATPAASGGNPPAINPQTGSAYSLALADAPPASSSQGIVTMNNAAANAVTVTKSATAAWLPGTSFQIVQLGAGQTSVVADTGVTLHTAGTFAARAQFSSIVLTYLGIDVWTVGGDTA
jgi:hypothetical protein